MVTTTVETRYINYFWSSYLSSELLNRNASNNLRTCVHLVWRVSDYPPQLSSKYTNLFTRHMRITEP